MSNLSPESNVNDEWANSSSPCTFRVTVGKVYSGEIDNITTDFVTTRFRTNANMITILVTKKTTFANLNLTVTNGQRILKFIICADTLRSTHSKRKSCAPVLILLMRSTQLVYSVAEIAINGVHRDPQLLHCSYDSQPRLKLKVA
jgi:hypothetical protein